LYSDRVTRLERALTGTLLWMTAGAAAAVPSLFLPEPEDPLITVTVHLGLLVVFAVGLVFHLAPLGDEPWFEGLEMGENGRRALTWVSIVVMTTGATGLVTLATSAALRFDPSLQFLQMLSALDIAWAAAALTLGLRRRIGVKAAVFGASVLGIVCVWAIWRYLDTVGFTADGGWILEASALRRLVLPYDMGAAVVALTAFSMGIKRTRAGS
jgi:hypothetical protein